MSIEIPRKTSIRRAPIRNDLQISRAISCGCCTSKYLPLICSGARARWQKAAVGSHLAACLSAQQELEKRWRDTSAVLTFMPCPAIQAWADRFLIESRRRKSLRGGFWRKPARSFAMSCLAIAVLADRSWMWCKARDRADNLRSHHALAVQ